MVGTHFFAPAYHMKLLENIYGTKTSPEAVATVMKLGKTINKVRIEKKKKKTQIFFFTKIYFFRNVSIQCANLQLCMKSLEKNYMSFDIQPL